MLFGMLSRVGPGNIVLHGNVDALMGRGTVGGLVCSVKFPRNLVFVQKIRREILHFLMRNMLCPTIYICL